MIRYFVERPMVVNVIALVILGVGYYSTTRAPRETFPNISMPRLLVEAQLPGASARDVETKVTIPLEEVIDELNGVKRYHTVVTDSSSVTTVELHDEATEGDIDESERDLRTLIDGISDFPPEMEDDPTIRRFKPQEAPVVQVALSGPTERVLAAAKVLEDRFRRLDLTSRVQVIGLQDPEVRVLVDPARARALGVTLAEVVSAVQRRNVSSTGGTLESETDRRQVVLWSRFDDPADVGDTVLRFLPDGGVLRVRDVARIEVGREDTGLFAHTNGQPGVSIVVSKRDNADIIDTVDSVRAELARFQLPDQVSAVLVNDRSRMTRDRLDFALRNGIAGALLVIVVLLIFLSRGTALWVLLGVPLVFLGALALFPSLDLTINMVTLTGFVVAIGMIVDAAIVVSERIVTRCSQGETPRQAAVNGATEMWRPVLASVVTTLLAFLPMWGLGGMAGRMLSTLPLAVMLVLALSLFQAFVILPGWLAIGWGVRNAKKRRFMTRLEALYARALGWSLSHRPTVVAVFALGFLFVMGVVAPRVAVVIIPQEGSEAVFIKVTTPLGTPLERTEAVVAVIERQLPGMMGSDLRAVLGRIGHQEASLDANRERGAAENEGVVSAIFVDQNRERTAAEWIQVMQRDLIVPPEAELVYQAAVYGPPQGLPVTLHVAANAHDVRRATAREIADWLASVDGVVNIEIDERPGTPQIDLNLDYERLSLRGLEADDVALTLKAAFFGLKASEHRDLDDTTEFRVMLEPSARRSLDSLLEIPVRARGGELVRLRDVVSPIEVPAVSRIFHRDGVRAATVTAAFAPGSAHTSLVMAERMEAELLPRYAGVDGLEIYLGGEAEESRKVIGDVLIVLFFAIAGITLVIALMLGSFVEGVFVISVIPFAVAGVILALFTHNAPLSLFSMMGSIGLAGVVVNSSIVMVDAVHRRISSRRLDPDERRKLVIEAIVERLRPILVTTLTTLGGVLPAAYGIGGYETSLAGMSLAIGWGLAFTTVVTLFLVPTLYTLASDLRRFRIKPPVVEEHTDAAAA